MLLLTSTSDKLQVVTGAACTIDVHASWMDNVAGAVSPGRTNTNITTATTTDVVGSPAASTQRNIKTLHLRNRGIAGCDVTVQHTDGTIISTLHKTVIAPNQTLQYIDEIGFIVPPLSIAVTPAIQVFSTAASGTYTPTPGMRYCIVECVGGGGGGGGAVAGANDFIVGGGGGSGAYSRKVLTAAQIGASQPYTVGAGGAPGGLSAGAGGDTFLGALFASALCAAKGGGGGYGGQSGVQQPIAGVGGSLTGAIGDIRAAGTHGDSGYYDLGGVQVYSKAGGGGSSYFGGGGSPPFSISVAGSLGSNYGGGGGGGASNNADGGFFGGAGSPGVIIITENF